MQAMLEIVEAAYQYGHAVLLDHAVMPRPHCSPGHSVRDRAERLEPRRGCDEGLPTTRFIRCVRHFEAARAR